MLDNEIKKEILKELDYIKFGNVKIELNETAEHVDIITERRKRIFKKKKEYDKQNIKHEG